MSKETSEWLNTHVLVGMTNARGNAWHYRASDQGDEPNHYPGAINLVACTSHDGSLSTTYKRTVTATVCDNTLAAALGEKGQTVKVKHSRYSNLRITDARAALELVYETADEFTEQVKRLTDWKVGPLQFKTVINAVVPIPDEQGRARTIAENKQAKIRDLLANDVRVAPWSGTAFGVLQAFNTWEHHYKGTRGADGGNAERNMLAALDGSTDKADALVLSALAATNV